MKTELITRCGEITDELSRKPINIYFRLPVNTVDTPHYLDVISTPMDFETIRKKLTHREYTSVGEWYDDVCLIYHNAMKFNGEGTPLYLISSYCLDNFQKVYGSLRYPEKSKWYEKMKKTFEKMVGLMEKSPVVQGIDPLVLTIIEESESQLPPNMNHMPDIIERLNRRLNHTAIRQEIVTILKETQPDLPFNDKSITIEVEKLSNNALNALSLYAKAYH